MQKKILVTNLIPTYNEKENIDKLINKLLDLGKKNKRYEFQILIVDDNSPDGTSEIVKKYKKKYKNIFLLSHKREGLGKAMIRGTNYCIQKLHSDVIISNEADFSFDLNKILYMLKKIDEGHDVVIASRHVNGAKIYNWPKIRKFNHFVSNHIFARLVAGSRFYDNNGAMRAIRVKDVMDKINLDKFRLKGYSFFNYSLFKLSIVTSKIYEFPAIYHHRKKGQSKIGVKYLKTYYEDTKEYIQLCFKIRYERLVNKTNS